MINDAIIWGSKGHALVVSEILGLSACKVVALFDNNSKAQSALDDIELYIGDIGFELWKCNYGYNLKQVVGVVAIGGQRGWDRCQIYSKMEGDGINTRSIFHPTASISSSAQTAHGNQFLANCVVAAGVTMGMGCIINHSATIDHECTLANGVHIGPGATLCGCVSIGPYSFIGAGATVLPHVQIGQNCTIGAGAVVTKNVPDNHVVAGNPAHYLKLNQSLQD